MLLGRRYPGVGHSIFVEKNVNKDNSSVNVSVERLTAQGEFRAIQVSSNESLRRHRLCNECRRSRCEGIT